MQSTRRGTWALRGKTPVQRVAGPRKHVSVISAITVSPRQLRLGLYFQTYHKAVSTEEAFEFMRSMRRSLRRKVIFVLDRLSVHRSAARQMLERFGRSVCFEWLPPYAPELNPCEGIWNHGKNVQLGNFPFADAKHLDNEVTNALCGQRSRQSLLRSFFAYARLRL